MTQQQLDRPDTARLGFLVRRFHAQVERQRLADDAWIATFERVARRNPRVYHIIREIVERAGGRDEGQVVR